MASLVAAAVLGHGVVALPVGWGDSEAGLERLFVLDAVPKRKIWLVTHESAAERPAVGVVAAHMATLLVRVFAR
jgi:DNA-binding transcriptional LysR family regulator